MRKSAEKLVEIGTLAYGPDKEVEVVYVIDKLPGDQPSMQEIEGQVHRIGERGDFADLMRKEVILKLRDGRRLLLSLVDAKGHFKAKGPVGNV